ncbi:Lrp/AsnC family transcriptional regulator [Halobacteriales archaeon QH_7_65_31]|nr:MAG: Lrp/AsnC family transcriptional regulator [Halobacteriales archaeon QH_7_65_31]
MSRGPVDYEFDRLDRAIVNAFQGGFPVVEAPFEPAAAGLRDRGVDIDAAALHARLTEMVDAGALSRYGALVNAEEIGGAASLVALHAPEDRYDEIAEQVNEFREVAHNYEREHPYLNMWFVVSVADSDGVSDVLERIEERTGQETYDMPKRREFHVGAKFLLDGPVPDGDLDLSQLGPDVTPTDRQSLAPDEYELVMAIQDGFPTTRTPYADIAAEIDKPVAWVTETIKRFDAEGKVRRVGVIPNHYALGYTENGMTVWNVPDDLVDEVGPEIAALEFVTHCYRRPRHEGVWPYNFFAMTHGRDEAESQRRIRQVRDVMADHWDVDDDEWDSLFSTRILKKTGIRLDERATANTVETEESA